MTDNLDGPLVYLAADRHAFIVLGNGAEAVITWSRSYNFAKEQADIHFGTVVAVPIVHDMAWRRPSVVEAPTTHVPVPVRHLPDAPVPVDLSDILAARIQPATITGYAVGRAARSAGSAGSEAGWSSTRADVVGQTEPAGALIQRVVPFGDPAAPELPADREEALSACFSGDAEALAAFHAPSQADVGTLEEIRDGLTELQ